jgi:hypothetical protein
MAIRPSTPEIITVNSEALQTTIRDLLPSQNGFGSELQASNVITPIIDLTPTAEGSILRSDLQTAINFGGATDFNIANATTTLANTPGFYRVRGTSTTITSGFARFQMSDGLSSKFVWTHAPTTQGQTINVDLVFWLSAGITLSGVSGSTNAQLRGSIQQIADPQGALNNPSGFPL